MPQLAREELVHGCSIISANHKPFDMRDQVLNRQFECSDLSSPLFLEGNVYLTEQLDHDDKDNEETDKDRYHPRALLLSGPPQVCYMFQLKCDSEIARLYFRRVRGIG